ncbi:hypothetical protein [Streptomyces sp. NPDC056785]|uniref:hypothetical protein n=1 Tax=Streptomyces sp. NPDC056785 TaxID=3345944 RepID=UPI00368D54BB
MPHDPYAVLHALLRAEAARDAQKPNTDTTRPPAPDEGRFTSSRPSPLTSPVVTPRKRGRDQTPG